MRGPAPARTRINGALREREVRLIGQAGTQVGVMPTAEAMRLAQEANLDLVEVQATADPPVCRLMDYGRHRYEQDRKERESRRAQKVIELKEVRVRPKTDDHDLETKRRQIRGWLGEGNRVQLTIRMRGREQAHPDVARRVLADLASTVADIGHVERDVLPEGRAMTLVLAPGTAPVRRASSSPRQAAASESLSESPAPTGATPS